MMETFISLAVFFIMWELWKMLSVDKYLALLDYYTKRDKGEEPDLSDHEKSKMAVTSLFMLFYIIWTVIIAIWGGPARLSAVGILLLSVVSNVIHRKNQGSYRKWIPIDSIISIGLMGNMLYIT
jgi:hypothetical protein